MKFSDSEEQITSWSERAREMSEAKILFASFFGGAILHFLISTIFTLSQTQSIKSRIYNYVPTQGYIDSIYIRTTSGSEERDVSGVDYYPSFIIRYSVAGTEFRTDYSNFKNEDSSSIESVEDSWKAAHRLAPSQAIYLDRKDGYKSACEFLLLQKLRSEIKTTVEVKYDPKRPEWNDWKVKNHSPFLLFWCFIFACLLIFLLVTIHAITKHRSLTSKILNWSFVLFIGLVTGPFFSGWEKVYAKLFPNHPLEPAQIIPFDERLDPKVCDALR